MDTGVLAIDIHQFAYPSQWTHVIATILFVLELILYIVFASIYFLRWTVYRRSTFTSTYLDPEQIALQACPAISWLTITILVHLVCSESWGYGFAILAFVMWWIALIWLTLICATLFLSLIKNPSFDVTDRFLPTAVFIPIVGMFTVANAAGVITTNPSYLSRSLSIPLIVLGFIIVGFSIGLSIVMYSVYSHRLMIGGWPAALKIPSMILTIGACGQGASALLNLGNAAVRHFDAQTSHDNAWLFNKQSAGIIHVLCAIGALLLLGFAIFWMIVSYYAIIEGLVRHTIHPSLFWWSTIFPVGTVVAAFASLGKDLDSPAFKIISVIIFIFLVSIYIVDACFTIPMTLSGEFLGLQKSSRFDWVHRNRREGHWILHGEVKSTNLHRS
jgi:tellurite resistance protein TehA-like permease